MPVEEMEERTLQTAELYIFPAGNWQVGFDAEDALGKGADEAALLSLWDFASCPMKAVQWDF